MDNTLALFVCDNYIQAAMLSGDGSCTPLHSDRDGGRYYLYFKNNGASYDYGLQYMMPYRNGEAGTEGDVLMHIAEGRRDLDIALYAVTSAIVAKTTGISRCVVSFSDSIDEPARAAIGESLMRSGLQISTREPLPSAIVKHFAKSRGLLCNNRRFAVVETLGNDLNMYLVNINGNTCDVLAKRSAEGLGVAPLARAIAQKIVNTVNVNAHIIAPTDGKALASEILRHYSLSEKVIAYFDKNPSKDTIKLSTNFACAPMQKYPVGLSREELYADAANFSRQYSAMFVNELLASNGCRVIDLENIILVGNTLENAMILKDFKDLGSTKVVNFHGDFMEFMDGMATLVSTSAPSTAPADAPAEDSEGTMFQMATKSTEPEPTKQTVAPPPSSVSTPSVSTPPAQPQYQEVAQIDVNTLKKGTLIYLDTFDSTPGKGKAFQELEYQGNSIFLVIGSSRSLAPGDIAQPLSPILQTGVQIEFKITRNGRSLGKFRTRQVVKISIK
ncbi:MAG: hypothetical protein K6F33_06050 [Bacteroidales bacterium]|nr:hypothetical protein [Bacteroidales bacterium]